MLTGGLVGLCLTVARGVVPIDCTSAGVGARRCGSTGGHERDAAGCARTVRPSDPHYTTFAEKTHRVISYAYNTRY